MRRTSKTLGFNTRLSSRFTRYIKGFAILAGIAILAACGQVTPDRLPPTEPLPEEPQELSWEWSPIGYDHSPLSASAMSSDFQVAGSGADIWDERDEFFYVYRRIEGDGYVSVRVADLAATDPWAKAGIMLRESVDPGARNVLLHISKGNGSVLQMREHTGGVTINSAGHDTTMPVGGWLRLSRKENTVIGELSRDGVSWSELGRYEVGFGSDALIGLAVTAHSRGDLATATFSDLKHGAGSLKPSPGVPADKPGAPGEDGTGGAPGGVPEVPTQPAPVPPAPEPAPQPTPQPGPQPDPQPAPPAPSKPAPDRSRYALPAATLYVATNGNDGNSGRSASSPLRTLARAATMVRPGDVVYVRGGVYPINISFKTSGTASQPIVWASYPGETAILDGSDQARGSSQHRVWVDGVSYNHFVNLEVRNGPQQGIFVRNANDNLFHGIVTHGNNGSGIQNYSGNRNRYEYIVTYDNFDTVTSNGKIGDDADGIGISSGDSNVISHVISYYNSDDGIDAWRSTNTLIEYSISYDNGRGAHGNGNGFKLGGNSEANYTVARFNIAFGNKATGFSQNTGRYVTLYNNTAFDNAAYSFDVGNTVTLRNNIAIGGRLNVIGGADSRSNSWDLGISDPRFVSTDRNSDGFLALRADSPAVGAGTDVGLPFGGRAPDLGAVQYGATLASALGLPSLLASSTSPLIGSFTLADAR